MAHAPRYPQEKHDLHMARCKNNMIAFAQAIYPVLIERLKKGYSIKNDGSFFKKDADIKELVKTIAAQFKGDYAGQGYALDTAYIGFSCGVIRLEVKGIFKISDESCDYIQDWHNLVDTNNNSFYALTLDKPMDLDDLSNKRAKLKDLEEKHREMGYEISRLKRELNV